MVTKQLTIAEKSLLNLKSYSDELIDSIHFWVPPVSNFVPRKKKLNSALRIAAIVDERLYRGLRYEGELYLLTPDNWKKVLDYGEIDFLMVESSWKTVTGHWYLGQYVHAQHRKDLLEIVSYAQKNKIPTVYWNTQSYLYHSHYGAFATNFDFVFCADIREADLMQREGKKAEILLPAVQPAVHNGFTEYDPDQPEFTIDVLYDGFTDIYRLYDKLKFLHHIVPYGLRVIESQVDVFTTKTQDFPFLKEFLGTVRYSDWLTLLKHTKVTITTDATLRTDTLQQWQTLETAACRVPVVHRGTFVENDIRQGMIHAFDHDDDLLLMLESFHQDDLYRERVGHLQWRQIYQNHTFSHRIEKLCKVIDIKNDYEEYPPVSIITPTFREERITKSIETFVEQTYPNKELVLVVNNSKAGIISFSEFACDNIKILTLPEERFAGAALNIGNTIAKGLFYFRMDDDDYYGENYILDAILHLKSVDAKVFGSLFNYVYLEVENKIFSWKGKRPSLQIFKPEFNDWKHLSIAGNTLAGDSRFFSTEIYQENNFGSADTSFVRNIRNKIDYFTILDNFNMIVHRSKNATDHTWRMPKSSIKDASPICVGINLGDLLV